MGGCKPALPIDLESVTRGVRYVHRGLDLNPKAVQLKRRRLVAELRLPGYKVDLAPLDLGTAPGRSM
jgi:hypothetical protein